MQWDVQWSGKQSTMKQRNEKQSTWPTKQISFQSISRYELLFKILKFSSSANHGGQHFFRVFFWRGHWISNLNPEIGRGHEIIIAFGGLHGPKHRYWCVMTTRSCNFDKSQYRQLRMGYDYEIGQQVHLLEKNLLGTSCQLLVM